MPVVHINYVAVLVCGVVSMILGSLWYGPLFGRPWAMMMGFSPEKMAAMKNDPVGKKKMMNSYAMMFVASLVMACVLAHVIAYGQVYMHVAGVSVALQMAFWGWLGFVATTTVGMVLWENKSWRLWWIVSGYYLVQLCLFGVILSLWK